MKQVLLTLVLIVAFAGCINKDNTPTIKGTLSVLNGPTNAIAVSPGSGKSSSKRLTSNGTYALSPAQMTLTITGIGFIPEGGTQNDVRIRAITGSKATYDRTRGSLIELSACDISIPIGTFIGVMVQHSVTYAVVMDDSVAGIYSDPSAPGMLTSTRPAGGSRPIQIRDQNSSIDFGQVVTYFSTPITIDSNSPPRVYVVFDPTHWVKATINNGIFSAPYMAGNPPIIPSLCSFGKATYYSNIATDRSYRWDGNAGMSLLFLYADDVTPVSVTWQDHDICAAQGGGWVMAFNGNGTLCGTYGMLGLDANRMLAWASSAGVTSDRSAITGYNGVFRMQELSTLGGTANLYYQCTPTVPQPISGRNYSSGAPDFIADGTLALTLLKN